MLKTIAATAFLISSFIILFVVYGRIHVLAQTPATCCLARHMKFSTTRSGKHTYSAVPNKNIFSVMISSDGRGFFGEVDDPVVTDIPAGTPIEALVAATKGAPFSSDCSTPDYTGNATKDLACYINAARSQRFSFIIGSN
jgi:hypothetical protein